MQLDHDRDADDESAPADHEQLDSVLSEDGGEFVVPTERKSVNRGSLVLFGILVLGAAGVYLMHLRTGPSAAAAAPEAAAAKKTIEGFLGGGGASIKAMEDMLRNTERVVRQFLDYPSMTQVPLSDLRINPFRAKPALAPSESQTDAQEKKRREEERLAILKAVQNLSLQSIICSDQRKACMINNTLYREGQLVDGFNVERITPAAVVVKNGPYRFELKIQR